jgi:patatin-like phospholipase/acyl hydrolase
VRHAINLLKIPTAFELHMPFRILSLSGGGFLGLYTIAVLGELEAVAGRPLARCFDLIAGTSVGGIIALALANEISVAKIQQAFEKNGSKIFSNRPAPTTRVGEFVDFVFRSFLSSKYKSGPLRTTIEEILGADTLMGDLAHPIVVPAINLTTGYPQIFKTPHHVEFQLDHRRKVVDVALATSAAPTYFPVASIDDALYADGGLFANSPDLIAVHEAEHFFRIGIADIHVLSVGTTTTQYSFSHAGRRNLGVWGWGRRLAQTIISAQQMDVHYLMQHRLASRYVRIDAVQSKEQEKSLGLDVATKAAQSTIRGLAEGSVKRVINDAELTDALRHTAADHKFFYGSRAASGV